MDPALLVAFLDEAAESLTGASERLLSLDRGPDPAAVESAFRALHSVKGNCAFFGLMQAKALAHDVESLLGHLRDGSLVAAGELVSLLLTSIDTLAERLRQVRLGGDDAGDLASVSALRQKLRSAAGDARVENADIAHAVRVAEEYWIHGGEARPALRQALETLIAHARSAAPSTTQSEANTLHPALSELRTWLGEALTQDPDQAAMSTASSLLGILAQELTGDAKELSIMLRDGWALTAEASGFDPVLRDWLLDGVERLSALPGAERVVQEPNSVAAHPSVEVKEASRPVDNVGVAARTMRVTEERIDNFLRLVGELLVVGDMLGHIDQRVRSVKGSESIARDLRRALDSFTVLSSQLQRAIMDVRMVPARPLLHKVPRLVRDVAVATRKQIRAEILGEEQEIDKRLIDLLDAPLVHMVRNACDHGIESPDERTAHGKASEGLVTVRIQCTATMVVLSISDDGKGVDLQRVRHKAERLGLLLPSHQSDESELLALLFAPGFSTSETVTELSGRGVGLDAVKQEIESAGGTVEVRSVVGQGTTMTVAIPKKATTQIIGGYVVQAGGQTVVLPLDRVRETFRPEPGHITTMQGGRGRMILRHGRLIPVISLSTCLGAGPGKARALVVMESRRRQLAAEVDAVIGVQKVVVRPLLGLPSTTLLAGAALMGDGTAALILAPDGLFAEVPHA